ncbi:MAG: hypothetical protein ACWA40_10325 [Planktomarina sp.]
MDHENSTSFDLFGNVVFDTPKTKGRPPFERTEENARKISMLLAMGWSNARIAGVIRDPRTGKSISVPTLKRYFRSELKVRDSARDQMMARQMMRVWEAAEGGNVGAERVFMTLLEKNDLMQAATKLDDQIQEKKPEAMGKKQIRAMAANTAKQKLDAELKAAREKVRGRIN